MLDEAHDSSDQLLRISGSPYDRFRTTEEEEIEPPEYSGGEIPIGEDAETGEEITLRIEDDTRIGLFGESGSGKTTLAKTILSRLWKGGWKIFHAADIKHDFHDIDNKGGASQHLINVTAGLSPGEEPESVPKEMYQPKFLYDEYGDHETKPSFVTPFTLGFEDISKQEFIALVSPSSTKQEQLLTQALEDVPRQDWSFSTIRRVIEEAEANQQLKQSLLGSIDSVESEGILSNRYRRAPLEDMQDKVVSLGLENWDRFRYSGKENLEMYIAFFLRKLKDKIRNRDLSPPAVLFIDEAHAFLPADGKSLVKQEAVDYVDVFSRSNRVIPVVSSQKPSQLPNPENRKDDRDIVGALNVFFLAPNLADREWKTVLKATNLYRSHGNMDRYRRMFQEMDKYQWLMIQNDRIRKLDPYAPLWAHTG